MANTFLPPGQIAALGLGLLERELVIPSLVWRDADSAFAGKGGETVTVRVPARTNARTRTLRGNRPAASEGNGIITMDSLVENSVDVTLDTDVYNAIPVTDEELTLDIDNFGERVLAPQVRAVAEGIENAVVEEMATATYATTLTLNELDPYKTAVDANTALNKANVARTERVLLLGADFEGVFLKSDHLSEVDKSGSDSALRQATIGRVAGFDVVVSNAVAADTAYAFHRTAFVLAMRAPDVPAGAPFGQSQSYQGLAMRWLRDYDFRNVQDRSLVDTFIGTNVTKDGGALVRAVKITAAGAGA